MLVLWVRYGQTLNRNSYDEMCSWNGEIEMNRDKAMKEIMETAHKMKSGEIPVARTYESIEAFVKALKKW